MALGHILRSDLQGKLKEPSISQLNRSMDILYFPPFFTLNGMERN